MNTEYMRTLYAYNAWANGRILDTTAQLTPEQLLDGSAGFPSVRDTLVHVLSAQWVWLSRWKGVSPRAMLNPNEFPDLAAVRARWEEADRELYAFIGALDQDGLAREVHYLNTKGKPFAYPLWQLLFHQVNHATQHRSEIAVRLTLAGHSPGEIDLIRYLDAVKPSGS